MFSRLFWSKKMQNELTESVIKALKEAEEAKAEAAAVKQAHTEILAELKHLTESANALAERVEALIAPPEEDKNNPDAVTVAKILDEYLNGGKGE